MASSSSIEKRVVGKIPGPRPPGVKPHYSFAGKSSPLSICGASGAAYLLRYWLCLPKSIDVEFPQR